MERVGLFRTMGISAAGLSVQRMKLETIAQNLANAETTRTVKGGPYRRKTVSINLVKERFTGGPSTGLRFRDLLDDRTGNAISTVQKNPPAEVPEGSIETDDKTPFTLRYDPGHPDADENGVVQMPNVNVIDEMVDMITATRAYEANVTAIQAAKDMFLKALEI